MKQLSSVDLYFLNQEFQILKDSRIETFYLNDGVFYMKFYVAGKGSKFLVNSVSKFIYLDSTKATTQSTAHHFVMYLRKYLKGGILRSIEQIPQERILKLEISKKEGEEILTYFIFFELFAGGNIILTNENLEIKNALTKKNYKDRSLKAKQTYELPPKHEFNIETLNLKSFEATDLSLVKFLALKLGLGGKNAEEVCAISGIDKDKTKLNPEEANKVIDSLKKFFSHEIDPQVVKKEEKIEDFFPFSYKSCDLETTKVESFNEAVKLYFSANLVSEDKREETFKNELKRLEKRLKSQEAQRDEVLKSSEELNFKGEKIYENYTLVEELLSSIRKAAEEKGWEYVLKKARADEKLSKIIKKIDYKNNKIILEL